MSIFITSLIAWFAKRCQKDASLGAASFKETMNKGVRGSIRRVSLEENPAKFSTKLQIICIRKDLGDRGCWSLYCFPE